MSTREERRQQRTARLFDQLEAAAIRWAEAEHRDGVDSGRHGVVSASVTKRRDQAEQKVRDLLLELRQAIKRPPAVR